SFPDGRNRHGREHHGLYPPCRAQAIVRRSSLRCELLPSLPFETGAHTVTGAVHRESGKILRTPPTLCASARCFSKLARVTIQSMPVPKIRRARMTNEPTQHQPLEVILQSK